MVSCYVSRTPVLSEKVTEVDFKFFLLLRVCVFWRMPVSRSLESEPSNDCRHDTTSQRTRKSGSTQTRRLADYGYCEARVDRSVRHAYPWGLRRFQPLPKKPQIIRSFLGHLRVWLRILGTGSL